MKFHLPGTYDENGTSVMKILISLLNLPVTFTGINEIKNRESYPSLQSLSDSLTEWNIENMAVNIDTSQLTEISYPCIAHINKNDGHFVVLRGCSENEIEYIDPEKGSVVESLTEFGAKWSGIALLIAPNENSGEEGYKHKRADEILRKINSYTAFLIIISLLLLPWFLMSVTFSMLLSLKLIGTIICSLLLLKQFGATNRFVNSLCKSGKKINCDALIMTTSSAIFGIIYFSELGMLYFVGGAITLIITAFVNISIPSMLTALTLAALPFTFASIYYQWRIAKTWCPLCVAVMIVIWLEFGFFLLGDYLKFESHGSAYFLIAFTLPLLLWLFIRTNFINSLKVPLLEKALNRFVKSEKVFRSLLNSQPSIDTHDISGEFSVGPTNAKIVITLVSNPECGSCVQAHKLIEDLFELHQQSVRVRFRFLIDGNKNLIPYKVVHHFLKSASNLSDSRKMKMLSSWYNQSDKTQFSKWMLDNPVCDNLSNEEVDKIISEQTLWSIQSGIVGTPMVVINDKQMPDEFPLFHLKYHIRKMLEFNEN